MPEAVEAGIVLVKKARRAGAGTLADRVKSGRKPENSCEAALVRCMDAWRRAYQAEMELCEEEAIAAGENPETAKQLDEAYANHFAKEAYRKAIPLLENYEGIRDYIACAAHGILIGAIPPHKCGHVLYAAQVALSALRYEPAKGGR